MQRPVALVAFAVAVFAGAVVAVASLAATPPTVSVAAPEAKKECYLHPERIAAALRQTQPGSEFNLHKAICATAPE